MFYVFIKSIQKIVEINRNLKQMRSITRDTETTSSLKDLDTVRDTLQRALKRIDLVISELGATQRRYVIIRRNINIEGWVERLKSN